MFFHKNVTYGIKAVLYLSKLDDNTIHSSKDISRALHIPKEFTSKVLQSLTKSGIIYSQKGKGGGFRLAKDPRDIKIIDVIYGLDKNADLNLCLFGFKECKFGVGCPMHNSLSRVRNEFYNVIYKCSVKELLSHDWFRF